MKKIYKVFLAIILLLFIFIILPKVETKAQEENTPNITQEEKENKEDNEEGAKEPTKTISEQTQNESTYSFGTILLAILIPCTLIIIAYLIFKFVKF